MGVDNTEFLALQLVVKRLLSEVAFLTGNPSDFLSALSAEYDTLSNMALERGSDAASVAMFSVANEAKAIVDEVADDLE